MTNQVMAIEGAKPARAPALRPSLGRQFWVMAHRWAGLTMAFFLALAGLTGVILPFEDDLEWLTGLPLSAAAPTPQHPDRLAPGDLAARIETQTGGLVVYLPLNVKPGRVVQALVAARPGQPPLGYDQVWADPYTGQVKLERTWGRLAPGQHNLVPFLYRLHYSIALGRWGQVAFGIAALVWTIDCFVGFYLTLPVTKRAPQGRPAAARAWFKQWRSAWAVRWRAGGYKLNFDLHRAGGLWLWPLLLVFAWSSVGLNLPTVFDPAMAAVGAAPDFEPPAAASPASPSPNLAQGLAMGRGLMAAQAKARGFSIFAEDSISDLPASGLFIYRVRSSLDARDDAGRTGVWFDPRNGRLVHFDNPTGPGAGEAARNILFALHTASVGGLAYRIFVSVIGAVVVCSSVTGVVIWTKKRSARLLGRRKRQAAA